MIIFEQLESFPWIVGTLITVLFFVAFTVIGIFLVHKYISLKTLRAHHDVAGVVFANIGVLYAVLLGFTVVNVQQRFDSIKQTTRTEAIYLAELYEDVEIFPQKNRDHIRRMIKDYGNSIVEDEWSSMASGMGNTRTSKALKKVWSAFYELEPNDNKQKTAYAQSIARLNNLMGARLTRLLGSEELLGSEMWTLLILGAFVMMGFIWFFGLENLTSHIVMGAVLAATIAFLLFLIYSLDTAFIGGVSIPPEALKKVLQSFDSS